MTEQTSEVPIDSPGNTIHRRVFHLAVIYILGALIGIALAIPTLLYLFMPPRTRRQSPFVDAGDISNLPPGEPVEMSFQQSRVDGWRVVTEKKTAWVVKESANKVVAFGPQCTHLGCAYHWARESKKFECPCHGSFFSTDGKVLAGPATRPLDRYAVKIQNNRLQVGPLRPSGQQNV